MHKIEKMSLNSSMIRKLTDGIKIFELYFGAQNMPSKIGFRSIKNGLDSPTGLLYLKIGQILGPFSFIPIV
jgi:hypothetical protein